MNTKATILACASGLCHTPPVQEGMRERLDDSVVCAGVSKH